MHRGERRSHRKRGRWEVVVTEGGGGVCEEWLLVLKTVFSVLSAELVVLALSQSGDSSKNSFRVPFYPFRRRQTTEFVFSQQNFVTDHLLGIKLINSVVVASSSHPPTTSIVSFRQLLLLCSCVCYWFYSIRTLSVISTYMRGHVVAQS
jgi:hypothetical protein